MGFDEATPLGFDITARDRGEIDAESLGEPSLRRQPVSGDQRAGANVVRQNVGDREIARLVAAGKIGSPGRHGLDVLQPAALVKQLTGYCCERISRSGATFAVPLSEEKPRLRTQCVAFNYSTSQPEKVSDSVFLVQPPERLRSPIEWIERNLRRS